MKRKLNKKNEICLSVKKSKNKKQRDIIIIVIKKNEIKKNQIKLIIIITITSLYYIMSIRKMVYLLL